MTATWFYYDNDGKKQGPFSGEQLKWLAQNGKISLETMLKNTKVKPHLREECEARIFPGVAANVYVITLRSSPAFFSRYVWL